MGKKKNIYRVVLGSSLHFTLYVVADGMEEAIEKAKTHAKEHEDMVVEGSDIMEVVFLGHAVE